MADENPIKRAPTNQIRQEPGAHELASSPDMKAYLEFIKAVIQDHDPAPELEAIRQLPLEKRYIWRVASALNWGFADFDKVIELLKLRPMQFCIFLKTLVGAEEMQRMMIEAIGVAKKQE